MIYAAIYSPITGWVLGKIVDHTAIPLNDNEVMAAAKKLNERAGAGTGTEAGAGNRER